jgi:hypothetical protein
MRVYSGLTYYVARLLCHKTSSLQCERCPIVATAPKRQETMFGALRGKAMARKNATFQSVRIAMHTENCSNTCVESTIPLLQVSQHIRKKSKERGTAIADFGWHRIMHPLACAVEDFYCPVMRTVVWERYPSPPCDKPISARFSIIGSK